ncbi:MAG TPA: diacylglycerol kinase family protein [Candidatus Limnocylindrales bacterium]|nr:diacylglycerol kinase family protein [Candidatus Limnocylindrales bacterium]
MAYYSAVSIIYNPKSTGPSKAHAYLLARNLRKTSLKDYVKVLSTKYAGHGEDLAYQLAKASPAPLIISSSGDGGYNDIINGAMKAQEEGAHPVTGLLPAGNANDHYHNLHQASTESQILSGKTHEIDLLRLSVTGPDPWQRYAHSYIGFGLTPKVGEELNKTDLNAFKELVIAAKAFYDLKAIKLRIGDSVKQYDSLIFSNVQKMSKVLSLSDSAAMHDGKFEITIFPHRSKTKLMLTLLKAATKGLSVTNRASEFTFHTIEPLPVQLDGEISHIAAGSEVKVDVLPKALSCVV